MSFADVLSAPPKEPELYRILGCDEKATTDQITAEYRARVRDLHPDKNINEKSEETTDKFVELQTLRHSPPPAGASTRVCMNAYSFDGLLVAALLFICTCAYLKRVPRVSSWLLSEKKGFFGVFYKAAVIGVRLHTFVALSCLTAAVYVLFVR